MPKVKDLGVTVVPEQFGPMEIGPGGGGCYYTYFCTDCTAQPFSICGTTGGQQQQPAAAGAAAPCTDCTTQAFSICGTTPGPICTDCTTRPFSICGTSPIACWFGSHNPFTPCGVTWTETPCGGSWGDPWKRGGGLNQQQIDQIRQQLQAQLQALEEAEKKLGPQSVEEIEAREKQINAELEKLKTARANLKKK